jgi:hypothetical protein
MKTSLAAVLLALVSPVAVAVEALAEPMEADERGWTQVRITIFDTPDSKFVQELPMRHLYGLRTGISEYTKPLPSLRDQDWQRGAIGAP